MNQTVATSQPTLSVAGKRSTARIYWLEFRNEVLKNVRMPAYTISSLAFPLMFYVLFALLFGGEQAGGTSSAAYMLATIGSFGVVGAALFGYGVGIATERGQGWMIIKRASPMPPLAYFSAKTLMALLMSAIIVLMLFAVGALTQGIRMPLETWAVMFATMVLGVIPFCALGLAFGYLAGPNSAPVIVNFIYLPLGFFSGLWIPLQVLPAFIQNIAPWLPTYHLGQLALMPLKASVIQSAWPRLLYLAGFTAVFLGLAELLYRSDSGKRVRCISPLRIREDGPAPRPVHPPDLPAEPVHAAFVREQRRRGLAAGHRPGRRLHHLVHEPGCRTRLASLAAVRRGFQRQLPERRRVRVLRLRGLHAGRTVHRPAPVAPAGCSGGLRAGAGPAALLHLRLVVRVNVTRHLPEHDGLRWRGVHR